MGVREEQIKYSGKRIIQEWFPFFTNCGIECTEQLLEYLNGIKIARLELLFKALVGGEMRWGIDLTLLIPMKLCNTYTQIK